MTAGPECVWHQGLLGLDMTKTNPEVNSLCLCQLELTQEDTRGCPSVCRKFPANALGIQPAGEGSRNGQREQRGCGAVTGGSEADGCS